MPPGQIRILTAKLKHAALSDLDFTTKWGKPLVDDQGLPNFDFADFQPISDWIASRA